MKINPSLIKAELLWENPNQNNNSGFVGQYIQNITNLPNYSYIILVWKNNYYQQHGATAVPLLHVDKFQKQVNENSTSFGFFGSDYFAQRYFRVSDDTTIAFENCNQAIFSSSGTTFNQDNHCCIPVAVYGTNYLV